MSINVKPKEATAIINSLIAGVVPKIGVQHINVGRSDETKAIIGTLNEVKKGHSMVKFWIGDFGSGKSFMLHLINTVALKQNFVVANADFTPNNCLFSNYNGKALLLYSELMNNIAIQTKPEGGALPTLLEKWIEQIVAKTAEEKGVSLLDIQKEKYHKFIQSQITKVINNITDVGGYDFGTVVMKYYEAHNNDDDQLKRNCLKWLKGEYTTRTTAYNDLGVRGIINDANYYDMLKNFCKLFVSIGYSGFMVNLDEAVNLYKLPNSQTREKNYEKIMAIYNDCFQGKVENLFFNFAGTKEFLENERKGLYSYTALKTRLETNKFESLEFRDFTQPVIRLKPLSHEQIFILLQNLKSIFDFNYKTEIDISDSEIHHFMGEIYNKPGASEFLTPREVIRDFLNVLSILRQNPEKDKSEIFKNITIADERPKDEILMDSLDSIQEL